MILGDGSIYKHKGNIESISGQVDNITGSLGLRAVFNNPEKMQLSGSSGNVQIHNINNNVIIIPQSATVKIQDKCRVYKVVDGKAKSEQITVSPHNNGTEYIVISGLNEGDIIVSDGVGLLREGMNINLNKE